MNDDFKKALSQSFGGRMQKKNTQSVMQTNSVTSVMRIIDSVVEKKLQMKRLDIAEKIKGSKGDKGERGLIGPTGPQGINGIDGEDGKTPDHKWEGTKLQFEKPDGSWGSLVELKGKGGGKAMKRGGGATSFILMSDTPRSYSGQANKIVSVNTTGTALEFTTPSAGDMLSATYDPASISEQLVGLTATQTLTNKTLTSPLGIVTNDVTESTDKNYVTNAQKTVIGNTSNTNTGDQDLSTYVTKNGVQTLTNKTLTNPVVNNPSGIVKGDVGLGNVPNLDTSDASNITSGVLSSSVLPPIALTSVQVAADETAMLSLTTEEGDVVVRSDENKSYMDNGGSAGTMDDFTELQTPTDSVLSVNGETGTVVLNQDEVLDGATYVRTHNDLTDTLKTIIDNTSGTNTGDQDLSGYVETTGNETIDGIKTFSSSPVVPTPTTDLQTATKKYVDDNAGGAPEGTVVKSTGETTVGRYLGTDGDDTCSWYDLTGGGDMSTSTYDSAGIAEQLVGLTATQTLSNKTLTTPNIGTPSAGTLTNCTFPTLNQNTTGSSGSCTGNSATVTNATLTTALTVNTGTLTLTANNANTSVLTIGAGASSISGTNNGDQDLSGKADVNQTMYIGTTGVVINRGSAALTLAGITLTTPALGTPSALVGTNITGTASGLTAGNVTTNANLTGEVTSSGNASLVADNIIDEANLKVNTPTNDYVLTADSAESGGMKWAANSAGFSDPMTTRGDIIYRDNTNTTTRLGVGTNGQVLTTDGTDLSWGAGGSGVALGDSPSWTGQHDWKYAGTPVDIQNTTDSASNQVAIFRAGNRATPADNDQGYLSFYGDNDLGDSVEFGRMAWEMDDVTNDSKDSTLRWYAMYGNSLSEMLSVNTSIVRVPYYLSVGNGMSAEYISLNGGFTSNITRSLRGSSNTDFKMALYDSDSSSLTDHSASGFFLTPHWSEASSGNHPLIAGMAIKPTIIDAGDATVSDTASLYIEGAADSTVVSGENYALWVDDGLSKFDGAVTIDGALTATLTGNADTVSTITGLAPDTATTQATQVSITTCANLTTVGTLSTGNATAIVDAASTTAAGKVELATDAEMTTGTATDRAITPANAKVELDKKLALAGGTMTGAIVAADHGTATDDEVVNIVYGTGDTPPTANTTTIGTLYVKYVA